LYEFLWLLLKEESGVYTLEIVTEFFFIIDPDKKDCSSPSKEETDAARLEKNQERPESSDFDITLGGKM